MSATTMENVDPAIIHTENPSAKSITYYAESERPDFDRIKARVMERNTGRVIGNVVEEIRGTVTIIHEWKGGEDPRGYIYNPKEVQS